MKSCDSCGKKIVFGGKKMETNLYCNATCAANKSLLDAMRGVPENLLRQRLNEVHQGRCPVCSGPGPVDLQFSHRVWSAIAVTSWSTRQVLACRPCGNKRRVADT